LLDLRGLLLRKGGRAENGMGEESGRGRKGEQRGREEG